MQFRSSHAVSSTQPRLTLIGAHWLCRKVNGPISDPHSNIFPAQIAARFKPADARFNTVPRTAPQLPRKNRAGTFSTNHIPSSLPAFDINMSGCATQVILSRIHKQEGRPSSSSLLRQAKQSEVSRYEAALVSGSSPPVSKYGWTTEARNLCAEQWQVLQGWSEESHRPRRWSSNQFFLELDSKRFFSGPSIL